VPTRTDRCDAGTRNGRPEWAAAEVSKYAEG
jgi:hypothetical protein